MKNQTVNGLLFTVLVVAAGCDARMQQHQQTSAIHRPLKEVQTPVHYLQVDPEKGGEFHFSTGTVIRIPENAFTDIYGNTIHEAVQLEMEEFHSASDIFLSGITMHYEQNGEDAPFESAGMFRIDGTCNGKEIQVAKGKTIAVQLASKTNDANYDFFQLNKTNGKWERLSATAASMNQSKQALADSIKMEMNASFQSRIPALPEKGALVLDLEVDYRKYPQLRDFYGLAWQVDKSENAKEISDVNWDYTNLVSTGKGINDFKLELSNASQLKSVKVQPVISREERARLEKSYAKAIEEEAQARAEAIQTANQRLTSMSDFQRNLSVNGFGIYNCDRCIQYERPVAIHPTYMMNGKELSQTPTYYLLSNDNSAVLQYNDEFKMDMNRENRLLFVLGNGKLAFVSKEQLEKAALEAKSGQEKQTLELKQSSKEIKTPEDLQALLNRI